MALLLFGLFLLAVFLAWPTYGLSLVAYLILLYFWASGKAEGAKEAQSVKTRSVVKEMKDLPSWFFFEKQSDDFLTHVVTDLNDLKIPEPFLQTIFGSQSKTVALFKLAGKMECAGHSVTLQEAAVVDFVTKEWDDLPVSRKRYFANLTKN